MQRSTAFVVGVCCRSPLVFFSTADLWQTCNVQVGCAASRALSKLVRGRCPRRFRPTSTPMVQASQNEKQDAAADGAVDVCGASETLLSSARGRPCFSFHPEVMVALLPSFFFSVPFHPTCSKVSSSPQTALLVLL